MTDTTPFVTELSPGHLLIQGTPVAVSAIRHVQLCGPGTIRVSVLDDGQTVNFDTCYDLTDPIQDTAHMATVRLFLRIMATRGRPIPS
jgi:hypothetical protein